MSRPEQIWKLTYDEKMNASTVAQLLGVGRNYVYMALSRHRRKLGLPPVGNTI
jgi:DNA-directed RNA polymerase specialized sigma subunit